MIKDSEYILDNIKIKIKDTLTVVENRLINGNIASMEDYKYNLGMRYILDSLNTTIIELNKEI